MNTKSFEILIHSQYAFDVCRKEIQEYEDCRQTDTPIPKDPILCVDKARPVIGCYKQAEKLEPLCLDSFNDARECMFKADGNLYNCRETIKLFVNCQKDPTDFKDFLAASTEVQKKPKTFDFLRFRGVYDKFL